MIHGDDVAPIQSACHVEDKIVDTGMVGAGEGDSLSTITMIGTTRGRLKGASQLRQTRVGLPEARTASAADAKDVSAETCPTGRRPWLVDCSPAERGRERLAPGLLPPGGQAKRRIVSGTTERRRAAPRVMPMARPSDHEMRYAGGRASSVGRAYIVAAQAR